jgi:hypothetical protein
MNFITQYFHFSSTLVCAAWRNKLGRFSTAVSLGRLFFIVMGPSCGEEGGGRRDHRIQGRVARRTRPKAPSGKEFANSELGSGAQVFVGPLATTIRADRCASAVTTGASGRRTPCRVDVGYVRTRPTGRSRTKPGSVADEATTRPRAKRGRRDHDVAMTLPGAYR